MQYAIMCYLINYSLKIGNITWLWESYIGDKQTLKQGLYMWDSVEKDQTTLLMLTPVCINISKHNVNLIYMSALFENIASYLNEKKTTIQH